MGIHKGENQQSNNMAKSLVVVVFLALVAMVASHGGLAVGTSLVSYPGIGHGHGVVPGYASGVTNYHSHGVGPSYGHTNLRTFGSSVPHRWSARHTMEDTLLIPDTEATTEDMEDIMEDTEDIMEDTEDITEDTVTEDMLTTRRVLPWRPPVALHTTPRSNTRCSTEE